MKAMHIYIRHLLTALIIITASGNFSFAENPSEPIEPLALRKIMDDMGKHMQLITDGITRQDWEMVKKSSTEIAEHRTPPFGEKIRILSYIGTNITQFKDYDALTREAAITLSRIATEKDENNIISTYSTLQKTCLDCHQQFRQSFQEHFYKEQ